MSRVPSAQSPESSFDRQPDKENEIKNSENNITFSLIHTPPSSAAI